MTESALRTQDAVRAKLFFQELVSESSARNPPPVDSIIPPSAKMWLDDAVYFHQTEKKSWFFDLGIVFAVIAWSLWAIAGYTIKDIQLSYKYAMWSIVFLSLWIVSDAIDQGSFRDGRPLFFILNLVYIGGVVVYDL